MCPEHPLSVVRGGACGLAWVGAGTSHICCSERGWGGCSFAKLCAPDGLSLLKNTPPALQALGEHVCGYTLGASEPLGHRAPPLGADEARERRGFSDGVGLCLVVLDVRLAGRRWAGDPGGESSRSHQSLVDSGSLTWEVSAVFSCRQLIRKGPGHPECSFPPPLGSPSLSLAADTPQCQLRAHPLPQLSLALSRPRS